MLGGIITLPLEGRTLGPAPGSIRVGVSIRLGCACTLSVVVSEMIIAGYSVRRRALCILAVSVMCNAFIRPARY